MVFGGPLRGFGLQGQKACAKVTGAAAPAERLDFYARE